MGLLGLFVGKGIVALGGTASAVMGTVCLLSPATMPAAPLFFAAAESAVVMLVTPVDPVSAAVAVVTGPL